jgi:predicted phage-related endonuclease
MPAILGVKGAYGSRKKLLEAKRSGIDEVHSEATKAIFARGHEAEIEIRTYAEKKLGMKLDPIVLVDDELGVLASIDGYNEKYDVIVECKNSVSESKLRLARRYEVWEPYRVQVLAQMLVSGAKIGFLCMRDDVVGKHYLIPVEEDLGVYGMIGSAAKQFLKELHE